MKKGKLDIKGALNNNAPDKAVGGQAVMEGVMMRGKNVYALAVRNGETNSIESIVTPLKKNSGRFVDKFCKLPIVRGVVSFVSSLVTGMRCIYTSAEMSGLDDLTDENPTKFEKWLQDKFGDKLFEYVVTFGVVLALIFSVGLFMVLPAVLSSFVTPLLQGQNWAIGIVEGLVRICILLAYLFAISHMRDVKRLFGYHGAEHKTINCFEGGKPLTVENVRECSRLHKRCGTSFLLIVMIVSMVVFFFVRTDTVWLRVVSRVLLVPVIAGLSYEIIRWAGRGKGFLVNLVSTPGLYLQAITTAEPDDGQIEVAILAVQRVLENENN